MSLLITQALAALVVAAGARLRRRDERGLVAEWLAIGVFSVLAVMAVNKVLIELGLDVVEFIRNLLIGSGSGGAAVPATPTTVP